MCKQPGMAVLGAVVIAASLVLAPLTAQAVQPTVLDPGVMAAAQHGAGRVAQVVQPELTLATGVAPAVAILTEEPAEASPTPTTPEVVEPTVTPAAEETEPTPVPAEEATPVPVEEATPAVSEEPTPAVDFATVEKSQHDNEGISLQAPADWEVTAGEFGTVFNIAIPGNEEFIGVVQALGAEDFPGVLAVVLFRSIPDIFVQQFDETAQFIALDELVTGQQLPVMKITFSAEFDGTPGTGAVYILSPGAETYMAIAYSTTEAWPGLEAGVDLMVESIFFDPSLITLTVAEAGPLTFSDAAGTLEIEVPEGWQVADTDDETLPLIVVDPEFRLAGAMGAVAGSPEEEGIDLQGLLDAGEGEPDPAVVDAVVQAILSGINMSSDELTLDEALTDVFVYEGGATIRLVGDAQFDGNISAPIAIYVDVRADGVLANVVFGDIALAMEQEDALLDVIQTAQVLK